MCAKYEAKTSSWLAIHKDWWHIKSVLIAKFKVIFLYLKHLKK